MWGSLVIRAARPGLHNLPLLTSPTTGLLRDKNDARAFILPLSRPRPPAEALQFAMDSERHAQDDVIYLYALPRPSHSPSASSRSLQFSHEQADVRITRPKTTKSLRCTAVPTAVRNRNVLLGYARDSAAHVYGFFDVAGRFRLREEAERTGRSSDMCPFTTLIPISHDQVTYRRAFQHMTRRRVRDEVLRRLIAALGTHSRHGEI